MKLLWFGYLVYSLGNCVMKLCIETGLTVQPYEAVYLLFPRYSRLHIINAQRGTMQEVK